MFFLRCYHYLVNEDVYVLGLFVRATCVIKFVSTIFYQPLTGILQLKM